MRYMTSPVPSVVRNAAWPGSTPKYPSLPGTTTSSTVSATTRRVGVTTSSLRRSATTPPRAASWRSGRSSQALRHLAQLLGLLRRLADVAHHVERLLGEVVVLALDDLLEALHGLGQLHVAPLRPGEGLGDEHRLREKPLELARARDDQLVLVGQLLHAEDRDDVLQVAVPLQDRLHRPRRLIVLVAEDRGVEDP